jgi:RimJ/RimL family protein N-acetyltransferase
MLRQRVYATWAELAKVDELRARQVLVDADSALCPQGWVGVLRIEDTVTVAVPREELARPVEMALDRLSAEEATSPRFSHLLGGIEVLGPAALFYALDAIAPISDSVSFGTLTEVGPLFEVTPDDEVHESGLAHATSPIAVIWSECDGRPVAACGYRHWPAGIAHLGVLTDPSHRRRGLGRAVAAEAIAAAQTEGLLPQWRARPEASKALARSLRLAELGTQFSVQPSQSNAGGC